MLFGFSVLGDLGFSSLFSSVLDSFDDGVLVVQSDGRVVYANTAAEQMFLTSREQLVQRSVQHFLPPHSSLMVEIEAVGRRGHRVLDHACVLRTPQQGQPLNVLVDLQRLVFDVHSDLVRQPLILLRIGVGVDCDRQSVDEVQRHIRTLDGVRDVLARQMVAPLVAVQGAAQVLETSVGEADGDLVRVILQDVDDAQQLYRNLSDFHAVRQADERVLNIHEILANALESFMETSQGMALQEAFTLDYDTSLPSISGRRPALRFLFDCLLSNAFFALQDTGSPSLKIVSRYRTSGAPMRFDHGQAISLPIEVMIEDNGGGFSSDMLERGFEAFVGEWPVARGGHSGLGLTFAHIIAHDHGGIVRLENTSRGARIRLAFAVPQSR